nr:hypothetical protein [Tanacetum cinerariifolium]
LDGDDDDDDYDKGSIISMNTNMFKTFSSDAIMTSFPIEEPNDSLIIKDEDINTIIEKESDEENESCIENLFHIPNDCVVFSRPLFYSYGDTTSSEYFSVNKSILEEDIVSNLPFEFDEESISNDVNPIYDEVLEDIDCTKSLIDSFPPRNDDISFDFEADPKEIKSLLNHDALITCPKIDPFLDKFAGELVLINPGIDEINFDHEEDIRLIEKLLYDNSSPLLPEELNSKNSIEPFSPSLIPIKDSESLMEEIHTFLASNDSKPSVINSDSYDSKEDNLFLKYEPIRAS